MCAFGVELTLPVHRRARQDPYAGGTTGRRAAGAHPGDPWGVPRPDPIGGIGAGKGLMDNARFLRDSAAPFGVGSGVHTYHDSYIALTPLYMVYGLGGSIIYQN